LFYSIIHYFDSLTL